VVEFFVANEDVVSSNLITRSFEPKIVGYFYITPTVNKLAQIRAYDVMVACNLAMVDASVRFRLGAFEKVR
jgi:hypothetical protein